MTKQSQVFILNLARRTLEHYFSTKQTLAISDSEVSETLKEISGTFVTITKNGQLRGCIGHLEPIQEIYLDVIDNVLSAAFADPRFDPLQEEELKAVEIEVSVLSQPQELKYLSVADLLNKLEPLKHGVIIQKGHYSATYLPQVWEELTSKEGFLSSLCKKAGLSSGEWRKGKLRVQTYEAEVFSEKKFT